MLQRAERRSDPRKRAVACRDAILDWCYSHMSARDINEFTADVRANLEGDPFTDEEIISASRDLQETESHDQLVRIIEERPESCRVTETRGPPSRAVETSSAYSSSAVSTPRRGHVPSQAGPSEKTGMARLSPPPVAARILLCMAGHWRDRWLSPAEWWAFRGDPRCQSPAEMEATVLVSPILLILAMEPSER